MLLKTVEVGWNSGLVVLRIKPSSRNHYAVRMGASEALKLAKEIENVIAEQPSSTLGGGVLGDRPIAIVRFGKRLELSVCGDGKSYTTPLTNEEAREIVRRLKHAAGAM